MSSSGIDPVVGVQIFTLIAVILGIIFENAWAVNNKDRAKLATPVILIFAHAVLYYWCLFTTLAFPAIDAAQNKAFPLLFTNWSAILRCHVMVSLASMSAVRWWYDTKVKLNVERLSFRTAMHLLLHTILRRTIK